MYCLFYLATVTNYHLLSRVKRARYIGDCSTDEMRTPRKAKRNWQIAKKTITIQRAKLRLFQQRTRRLRARVSNLKSLLKHLESQKLISENTSLTVKVVFTFIRDNCENVLKC